MSPPTLFVKSHNDYCVILKPFAFVNRHQRKYPYPFSPAPRPPVRQPSPTRYLPPHNLPAPTPPCSTVSQPANTTPPFSLSTTATPKRSSPNRIAIVKRLPSTAPSPSPAYWRWSSCCWASPWRLSRAAATQRARSISSPIRRSPRPACPTPTPQTCTD